MRKVVAFGLLVLSTMAVGCARPGEIGWTPAYTTGERANAIVRSWDLEGKMMQDEIDHALLLRPTSSMSEWHVSRGP